MLDAVKTGQPSRYLQLSLQQKGQNGAVARKMSVFSIKEYAALVADRNYDTKGFVAALREMKSRYIFPRGVRTTDTLWHAPSVHCSWP